jgi:hypothetical protein
MMRFTSLFFALAMIVAGFTTLLAPIAHAQESLSAGCAQLNEPDVEENSSGFILDAAAFHAGETLTISADNPWIDTVPIEIVLIVDDSIVAEDDFPGTLTYTFSDDFTASVSWLGVAGDATWTVSCEFTDELPSVSRGKEPPRVR